MTALTIRLAATAFEPETHSVAGAAVMEPIPVKSESGISWRTRIMGMLTGATQILVNRFSLSFSDQLDIIIYSQNSGIHFSMPE